MQNPVRPSGENFSFDIVLAMEYGIEEALLIRHFQYWIRVNKTKGINKHHNRTWTYQTLQEIAAHFPFLNYEKVKYCIEKLVEKDVLIKGNYNKSSLDRTTWYAFQNEEIFVPTIPLNEKNVYEKGKFPDGEGKFPIGQGKFPDIPDTIPTDTTPLICSDPDGSKPLLSVKKLNSKKQEITYEISEIFRLALHHKKDWSTPEIEEAWIAFAKTPSPVNNAFAMISVIIENNRKKNKPIKSNQKKSKQYAPSEEPPLSHGATPEQTQELYNKYFGKKAKS